MAADGAVCTFVLECQGEDANLDGIPDAMAAALGDRLQEGVKLLTIQYTDASLTATTPYVDILVIDGAPVTPSDLPAVWQLMPVGR